jgi:hypothetical protein
MADLRKRLPNYLSLDRRLRPALVGMGSPQTVSSRSASDLTATNFAAETHARCGAAFNDLRPLVWKPTRQFQLSNDNRVKRAMRRRRYPSSSVGSQNTSQQSADGSTSGGSKPRALPGPSRFPGFGIL